jgi:hypothetical protein
MTRTDLVHFQLTKTKETAMAGALGWIVLLVVVSLLWQVALFMHRSKSEGVRRVKIVISLLLILALGAVILAVGGIGLLAGVIVALAAIAWIVRGFKD